MHLSEMLLFTAVLLGLAAASCTAPGAAAGGNESASPITDTLSLNALADTLPPAEAARYALGGRDLEGKDGPLAKIGYDLAYLYFAHEQAQASGNPRAFEPPSGARVADGRVVIDATAGESGAQLRAGLDALGLEHDAVAGPVVSGWLPIASLAEAAQLESLRSMRPSRAATRQ